MFLTIPLSFVACLYKLELKVTFLKWNIYVMFIFHHDFAEIYLISIEFSIKFSIWLWIWFSPSRHPLLSAGRVKRSDTTTFRPRGPGTSATSDSVYRYFSYRYSGISNAGIPVQKCHHAVQMPVYRYTGTKMPSYHGTSATSDSVYRYLSYRCSGVSNAGIPVRSFFVITGISHLFPELGCR